MEFFDLFNDDRIPLGKTIERGTPLSKGENRQVIHVIIFNSKNEMLIQKRTPNKKHWPSLWDTSCGGCCQAGETSRESAARELYEELGIVYDFSNERPFFTINFENGFDDVYILQLDFPTENVKLQPEEVSEAKWASRSEIAELISNDMFVPYVAGYVDLLFELRKQRGVIL